VQTGSITKVSAAAVVFLLCAACKQGPPKAPVIGEAFVGPAALKIRSDFPLQSTVVATVQHGDRLEILQVRRRFIRVRTRNGAEGWTDDRQLLAAADMQALRDLAASAAKMPSQGVATAYSPLNIHSQPALASPSFLQLKPNEKVDVLRSVLFPRTEAPARTPLIPAPKKKKAPPKKEREKKAGKYPPPPMPRPPALPPDWLDLSRTDPPEEDDSTAAKTPDKPAPKIDLWSLVRTPQKQAGWVLTRMLGMAIPDEVAQYAEGHRIVSYFPIGQVQDGDVKKTIWLWTTTRDSRAAWDFDSFRVFTWSMRRHRYETAHIERDIQGYSPVLLTSSGFTICMDKKDGQRMRREFTLQGNSVRYTAEQPCEAAPPPLEVKSPAPLPVAETSAAPPKESTWEGIKRRWKAWRGKK
jgi:Bacterial SH3 domain